MKCIFLAPPAKAKKKYAESDEEMDDFDDEEYEEKKKSSKRGIFLFSFRKKTKWPQKKYDKAVEHNFMMESLIFKAISICFSFFKFFSW